MCKLIRTSYALEVIKSYLKNMTGDESKRLQIENFLAQYLTVCFYAEMEEKVLKIYSKRLSRDADDRIKYFSKESAKAWGRLVPKSDISKLAACFGDDCKEKFNDNLEDRDVSIYSSVIKSRHDASHGRGGNVTIKDIEGAIVSASIILSKLGDAIQ